MNTLQGLRVSPAIPMCKRPIWISWQAALFNSIRQHVLLLCVPPPACVCSPAKRSTTVPPGPIIGPSSRNMPPGPVTSQNMAIRPVWWGKCILAVKTRCKAFNIAPTVICVTDWAISRILSACSPVTPALAAPAPLRSRRVCCRMWWLPERRYHSFANITMPCPKPLVRMRFLQPPPSSLHRP